MSKEIIYIVVLLFSTTFAMAMAEVRFLLGVFFLTSFFEAKQVVYSQQLDNLTSVIDLTESNFDKKVATKRLFVLFYEPK